MSFDGFVPWPADLAHAYRAAGVWPGRTMGSYLWEWAEDHGAREAVVDGTTRLTYRDLAVRADALAVRLADHGLSRGDTVLVQLPNTWEFVIVTAALLRLGVVPAMMLPPHRDHELTAIGAHVRAKGLVVPDTWRGFDHQELAFRVSAALPAPASVLVVGDTVTPGAVDVRALMEPGGDVAGRRAWLDAHGPAPSDIAVFLLSGGTTGVPKVISRTHDDYLFNITHTARACAFDSGTVYLAVLPAGHNFPLASPGIFGALHAGGRVVLSSSPRPEPVFAAIEAERVTATSAVPAVVLKWVEAAAAAKPDLASLRYVHVGGSMLAPEIAERMARSLGCRLQQVYGMAEGLVCYTPPDAPDELAFGTQGPPVSPFDELLVVDEDGRPVPPGGEGELLTRGPGTPRGYYGVPEQNKLSFTEDGWFRTGDLVRITPEGYAVVCGRVKDLINRGGEKISAGEVETLIQELPEVAEVAAVPDPDPLYGERVCVFVRFHGGCSLSLAEITRFLTGRGLAAFKIPERLEVLAAFPHTAVGKADKKALKVLLARIDAAPRAA
ncbi:(2,3-dihydroxybenzoyl)adenylate synthase [Amycolatopsis sp. Hca4]|uniref:(2,3-dihydroxybenzoyl)adenylate synthase n=1 Tax=Amycolatopsis sp. Hca4 TaxID=2742131 RepID=UPI000CA3B8AC|nr:AMP-binding protein [Amycolatopsis sp. Hca4]ATV95617.1 CoA ligase [Amycolatopsis sp.]QKV75109.1 AMP-binding protein [Amycolatopsis sp. Hca4]